jgi:hypothetical protein
MRTSYLNSNLLRDYYCTVERDCAPLYFSWTYPYPRIRHRTHRDPDCTVITQILQSVITYTQI